MKILHVVSLAFLMSPSSLHAMDIDPESLLKQVDRLAITVKKLTGDEKKNKVKNEVLPLLYKLDWSEPAKTQVRTWVISRLCAEYYASAYGVLGESENENIWQENVAKRHLKTMEIDGSMPIPENYVKNYKTQKYTHFTNK